MRRSSCYCLDKSVLDSGHVIRNKTVEVKVAIPMEEMRQPAKKPARIFVAKIPPSVTETTFRSYFETFGEITDLYMPKDLGSKAHRGIGFITFGSADSVDTIMAESHELGGSSIVVDRATPKDEVSRYPNRVAHGGYGAHNASISAATHYVALGAPTLYGHPGSAYGRGFFYGPPRGVGKKIFVGRLPSEACANDLRECFGRFGRILDVYVPKEPKRKGHRGFGFVTFADNGVADRVSRCAHEILGHEVAIDTAVPVDDVGVDPGSIYMDAPLEAYHGYGGPTRNYGRLYGSLDFDDYGLYGYGTSGSNSCRVRRMDWRYRPY